MLNQLKNLPPHLKASLLLNQIKFYGLSKLSYSSAKPQEIRSGDDLYKDSSAKASLGIAASTGPLTGEIFSTPATREVPVMLTKRETVLLPFEDVPGPSSLKLLARVRSYLSDVGTQLTAGTLTLGLSIGAFVTNRKPTSALSTLFDEYGPVVRFVSPIGGDIVLINNPEHIQKVFTMEGDHPVRSTLDSLEKYRTEHRNIVYGGLYNIQGEVWNRQRSIITKPLQNTVDNHLDGLNETCNSLVRNIYNSRNYHDEVTKDLYEEIHKWAFDCLGLLIFAKKFTMLDTTIMYSQCDMSWLYHSLVKSTNALLKCESGLQLWKLVPTPAWRSLIKYCDTLDNLIGKHVLEADQKLPLLHQREENRNKSLINVMLTGGEEKMAPEDVATVLMDMLLIGVNTITSAMSFLTYFLAKHQRVQKLLYTEIDKFPRDVNIENIARIKQDTPYLQSCIRETLRIVPPIPILTRILPKNIILDKYNIPRGTLIIMSTQDASLKESNFDDATRFYPGRWMKTDAKDYHAFASIPFGFGARRCLGQNIAEAMLSILTIKMMQKFKLEYHYGEITPTKTFIVRPNKSLKIRFIDRI